MRPKLPILSPLILLALVGAAGAGIIDPIEERIQRVFPFEVGQEYQFKCSGNWVRNNGEVLPAYTVAEITVRDTVINDETWLVIPYWSPFASDIVRLGTGEGPYNGRASIRHFVEWFTPPFDDFYYATVDPDILPTGTECVNYLHYASPELADLGRCPAHFARQPIHLVSFVSDQPDTTAEPSLKIRVQYHYHDWGLDVYHGAYGPGTSLLGSGPGSTASAIWGLFRPKSDDPWPVFDDMAATAIENPDADQPASLSLRVSPNPFNPSASIVYVVPDWGHASVVVYDALGRRVRELRSGPHDPGAHMIVWDGRSAHGRRAASGTYLVRVETERESIVKRVTLVR